MRMKPWIPGGTLCTNTKKTFPRGVFRSFYWKLFFYTTPPYGTQGRTP